MEILQHEDRLDGHRLEVRQGLHRIGSVVHGGPRTGAGIVASRRQHRPHQAIGFAVALRERAHSSFGTWINNGLGSGGAAAGADQAIGDGPLKDRQTQLRACHAHQRQRTHFLDRLHDDDGGGGVDEDFKPFQ